MDDKEKAVKKKEEKKVINQLIQPNIYKNYKYNF